MPDAHALQAARLDDLVEHWFFETFHGSAVARSTETWNAVHAAKEELKRRLAGLRRRPRREPIGRLISNQRGSSRCTASAPAS